MCCAGVVCCQSVLLSTSEYARLLVSLEQWSNRNSSDEALLSSWESSHTAAMRSATEVSLAIKNIHHRCNRSRQDRQPMPLQQQHGSAGVGGGSGAGLSSGAQLQAVTRGRGHSQSVLLSSAAPIAHRRSSVRRSLASTGSTQASSGGAAMGSEEADLCDNSSEASDDDGALSRQWRVAEAGHQQHIDGVACAWGERHGNKQQQWKQRAELDHHCNNQHAPTQLSHAHTPVADRRASMDERSGQQQRGAGQDTTQHDRRNRRQSRPVAANADTATANSGSAIGGSGEARRLARLLGAQSAGHPSAAAASSTAASADSAPLLFTYLSDIAERLSELQYVIAAVSADERQAAQQAHNEAVKQRQQHQQQQQQQQQQQALHGGQVSYGATGTSSLSSTQSTSQLPTAVSVYPSAGSSSTSSSGSAAMAMAGKERNDR